MPVDNARDRILQATVALLDQEENPEAVTVRQIAASAGVGVGAINYHFRSKDHLLYAAITALLELEAAKSFPAPTTPPEQPEQRVRDTLGQMSQRARRYPELLLLLARFEFEHGQFATETTLVPLLRTMSGNASEMRVRLAALQLATVLHLFFLRAEDVARFLGLDADDPEQRAQLIAGLVDNVCDGLKGT